MPTDAEMIRFDSFGDWLFEERMKHKWSRERLAELSEVDQTSIAHYENLGVLPRVSTFNRILNALGYEMVIKEKKDDL